MSTVAPERPSGTEASSGVSFGERLYFGAVAVLALWVGVWGYFAPTQVQKALPFHVPPLHARFLGSVYLSGVVITIGAVMARRWYQVRDIPVMTAIWTGGLGLISLLHLEAFPSDRPQTWIWFAAYAAYPLIAVWLARRHRSERGDGGAPFPPWARGYLLLQGVILVVVSAMLLLLPGVMVDIWPWPIDRMLAQMYSAPLLSYGAGSLLMTRRRRWQEIRAPIVGMFAFAALALVASLIHRDLFSLPDLEDVMWFAVLAAISVGLAILMTAALFTGKGQPASR
jgi:hypothetical protein